MENLNLFQDGTSGEMYYMDKDGYIHTLSESETNIVSDVQDTQKVNLPLLQVPQDSK